jgi:hypothetical protein
MRTIALVAVSGALVGVLAAAHGCGSEVQIADSASVSTGAAASGAGGKGGGGGLGGGASSSSGEGGAITQSSTSSGGCPAFVACQGHIYQCGDGIDNDGDGHIDADDPECLGPCDNTEENFYGGVPGQDGSPCRTDCYFDQDIGPGNDDCYWSHKCDPHEVAPSYYPESDHGGACAYNPNASTPGTNKTCAELSQTQSNVCLSYCMPLTPNGCDCFGCCELPAGSGKYAWLGSENNFGGSCNEATVDDPTKCQPCEPVPSCMNPCDACELCIDKAAVGPGCSPQDQCAAGIQPCGLPGQTCCPAGSYCITGCCQPTPQ